MMRVLRWSIECLLVLTVCVPMMPVAASASSGDGTCWPLREPTEIAVGFRERYTDPSGRTRTHLGVDLEASCGEDVVACASGSVLFSGRIPSTSGDVLAVTIGLPGGRRLTLSPLETVFVSEGESVQQGEPLGILSASGDPSCPSTHLHVSLREGEEYVDPCLVLVPPTRKHFADSGGAVVPEEPDDAANGHRISEDACCDGSEEDLCERQTALCGEAMPSVGADVGREDLSRGALSEEVFSGTTEASVVHQGEKAAHTSPGVLAAEKAHRELMSATESKKRRSTGIVCATAPSLMSSPGATLRDRPTCTVTACALLLAAALGSRRLVGVAHRRG